MITRDPEQVKHFLLYQLKLHEINKGGKAKSE